MHKSKVVTMIASVAALGGVANAGEILGVAPITSAGTEFVSKGKETVELRFAGRIHLDYNSLSNDGTDDSADDPETSNGFFFRRLRLGAKAKLTEGVTAETIYDFSEDGDGRANTVVIGIGDFKLGHQKVPFSYEMWESSTAIKGIERSVATRYFVDDIQFAGFHTGIHYETEFSGFTARGFIGNADAGTSSISRQSQDLAFFASLRWANDDLTVGADFGHQQSNEHSFDGDDYTALTAYVNYETQGLKILGEYFKGGIDGGEETDAYSIAASYKMDKVEPVLRYSYLDTDHEVDADQLIRRAPEALGNTDVAGDIHSVYAGVNYYHNEAIKFSIGYEYAEAEDDEGDTTDEISGLRARVQVLF